MSPSQAERFVDLLARSKAIWLDAKLLDLTESANSPTHAYDLVLEETGKRKKALAARWYAIALREAENNCPQVRAAVRFLKYDDLTPQRLVRLVSLLTHVDCPVCDGKA